VHQSSASVGVLYVETDAAATAVGDPAVTCASDSAGLVTCAAPSKGFDNHFQLRRVHVSWQVDLEAGRMYCRRVEVFLLKAEHMHGI
jgi:hypothetical protein